MSQQPVIVASPCEARNTACPGAHACLYRGTGHWRVCAGAYLDQHDDPRSSEPAERLGQGLAA